MRSYETLIPFAAQEGTANITTVFQNLIEIQNHLAKLLESQEKYVHALGCLEKNRNFVKSLISKASPDFKEKLTKLLKEIESKIISVKEKIPEVKQSQLSMFSDTSSSEDSIGQQAATVIMVAAFPKKKDKF